MMKSDMGRSYLYSSLYGIADSWQQLYC